ncbi:YeeE/YedE family protein [Pontibacter sp. G13]|uniref:YeeE/YedE family protein n=1 Tax=Pontibacter sp. G13 TaxID=3074898 RepID=UPI0039068F5C
MCSIGGAGKYADFFRFDWKGQIWNLMFAIGAIGGGFIAHHFMTPDTAIQLSDSAIAELQGLGFSSPGESYLPPELFSVEQMLTPKGLAMLIAGGLMVGFGTRYAGGCTSGHAITGLSNLQIPSLIAVIGFFIGGLLMTHVILPLIL